MQRKPSEWRTKESEEKLRSDFEYLKKQVENISAKYRTLCAGKDLQTLCGETAEAVAYTDKLVEILQRFEQKFFNAKTAWRGGLQRPGTSCFENFAQQ